MGAITQLGYLAFEVSDLAAWEAFATGMLGMAVAHRGEGQLALRMDGHGQRFWLTQGDADDLCALGLEVADEANLDRLVKSLQDAGHEVTRCSAAEADARRVQALVKVADPDGLACEIHCGPALAPEEFKSPILKSGFVADELGLGHAVVSSTDRERSEAFYVGLLGFVLSDHIRCEIHGYPIDVAFFHCNGRHHSLALGGAHGKRLHHFMIEVQELDEVGLGFDRALKAGVPIAQTIGRHPNDRMVSFYAVTPSGFQFEFGWGGRIVNDATWEPTEYGQVSEWGHLPPAALKPRKREARND